MRSDGMEVKAWSSLTLDEKAEYDHMWHALLTWLDGHSGRWQAWERVNKLLSHIYTFSINNYNRTHDKASIIWDKDKGVMMVKQRRINK